MPTQGANASSTTDYEELGYDASGNVTSSRNRAGETTLFTYDALNRVTLRNRPGSELDISYGYDLLGRMTSASQTGHALSFTYDALGRNLTQAAPRGTITSAWDLAGRRTRITYPDGFFVDQDYLLTGEMTKIRENGAISGVGVLATYGYDDQGRRTSLTRGNGAVTSYAYDAASRLETLTEDMAGTTHDLTLGFTYNPASQIATNTRSNDLYTYAPATGTLTTPANGLNQLTTANTLQFGYDARGNMTSDAGLSHGNTTQGYSYDSENRLIGVTGGAVPNGSASFSYDPLGRLVYLGGWSGRHLVHDGVNSLMEYDGNGSFLFRYVFGPAEDEPVVYYTSSGARRFLHADERGSIVAISDDTGAVLDTQRYDEYGRSPHWTTDNFDSRFQYTGQRWLFEAGLYHFDSRAYHPNVPRFMQTDPIGYGDGMNMYAYVGGDPVNGTDPSGRCVRVWGRFKTTTDLETGDSKRELVTKRVDLSGCGLSDTAGIGGPHTGVGGPADPPEGTDADIVVTGRRDGRNEEYSIWTAAIYALEWFGIQIPHSYQIGPHIICNARVADCSPSRVGSRILSQRCNIPGQNGTGRVVPGVRYDVYAGGIWGGQVTSEVSPDGRTVINRTTPLHIFKGYIARGYTYDSGGNLYASTGGQGNSAAPGVDLFNQFLGPMIFANVDRICAEYVEGGG